MINYRLIMSFQFYIIYFLIKNLRLNLKISFLISKSIKNFKLKLGDYFNFVFSQLFKNRKRQKIKKLAEKIIT